VLAAQTRWLAGGKGANQAAAAARLGATVRFLGAVGDDAAAEVALGGLADDGVDLASVRHVAGAPSGVAVVCTDGLGENLIVVAAGANAVLEPHDVKLPDGCNAVLASLEVPATTALAALQAARATGALAVLNAAPADAATTELLEAADVLVANEGEAAALAGGRTLAVLAADAGTTIVATAGPAGVRAATPEGTELHVPALQAEVVDTVGAGDCFAAALTVALAEGLSLADALAFGTAAATVSVGRVGARDLPTRGEVDALLGG
jgi:ribokinase